MKRFYALLLTLILTVFTLTGCKTISETVGQADSPQQVASLVQEHGYFDLTCRDSAGQIKWQETDVPNALANEGEYLIEDVMFRGNTAPTQYYLRLYNTTPVLTSTLSSLSTYEPSTANGYNPANQGITRDSTGWPLVPQLVSNHYEITSKTVTITATGAVGPVTYAALSTSSDNTGKLMAYAALSTTRTLASGDSLQMTYKIRLQ